MAKTLGSLLVLALALAGVSAFAPARPLPRATLATRGVFAGTPLAEAPDVGNLPDCPATLWAKEEVDVVAAQAEARLGSQRECPLFWECPSPEANAQGAGYFASIKDEVMAKLQDHGCVYFKGFDLMKTPEGFRAFYDAVGLPLCLDPIHTSGLRKMVSKKDGIYEEVNKPSLRGHYIGLHQESTHVKTSTYGAFVCFSPATVQGGEFLVADGAKILADLDPEVLQRIYAKKVRISVSNLDFNFLAATGPLVRPLMGGFKALIASAVAPKFDMELDMIYGADPTNPFRLQAVEPPMAPVNRHPKTHLPVWFCNIHNHNRYLRDGRPCTVPEVGMTDVYYGDLSPIAHADLDHIDAISRKHIVELPMVPGEVCLLDNYRMLHGRDVFEGDRNHAVAWFGEQSDKDLAKAASLDRGTSNAFNKMLNNYVENAF